MTTFTVWCPERGESEEDGRQITELTVRLAAEAYASEHAGFSGDPFKEITVRVASPETERLFDVPVAVRAEPVFEAGRAVEVEE